MVSSHCRCSRCLQYGPSLLSAAHLNKRGAERKDRFDLSRSTLSCVLLRAIRPRARDQRYIFSLSALFIVRVLYFPVISHPHLTPHITPIAGILHPSECPLCRPTQTSSIPSRQASCRRVSSRHLLALQSAGSPLSSPWVSRCSSPPKVSLSLSLNGLSRRLRLICPPPLPPTTPAQHYRSI